MNMIQDNLKIQLISDLAKIPEKGTVNSAGYDLSSIEEYELKPMERHLFKTGIKMSIPVGIYGRIAPRSGLAFKNGIDVMAGVIDPDFRGEIGVILINLSNENKKIQAGDKIAQMIFETYHDFRITTTTDTLDDTIRGSGGFGSTTVASTIPITNRQETSGLKIREISEKSKTTTTDKLYETSVDLLSQWKKLDSKVESPMNYESLIKEREKSLQQ